MILKTGYRAFKNGKLFILIVLILAALLVLKAAFAVESPFPVLHNGLLYIDASATVPVNARIVDFCVHNNTIIYVAHNDKEIVTGTYFVNDKTIKQFTVTVYSESTCIARIAFESSVAFILIHKENEYILYRIDCNTGAVQPKDGILDFVLVPDGIVLLKIGNILVFNEFVLPLYFTNAPKISGCTDNRILFISDGSDTEIIDIVAKQPLYRYSKDVQYLVSDDYTVEITISDMPVNEKPARIFYRIYCDGQDYGRSEPVLSINTSIFQLKVLSGQYHEIVLERWRLDESEDKYVRDNNIRQPKPIIIYVYPERIIAITLRYNGSEYEVTSGFKIILK